MCEVCEEIITLIIYNDESREVLHVDLANSLHTELWEVYNLDTLDRVFSEDSCRATDRAEVEATICLASIGNSLRAVTDACQANGGFYLGSIGGPAAILAKNSIKSVEVVDFPELGMEAVRKIYVENFPAFIIVDDKGNDFFADFAH